MLDIRCEYKKTSYEIIGQFTNLGKRAKTNIKTLMTPVHHSIIKLIATMKDLKNLSGVKLLMNGSITVGYVCNSSS